MISLWPRCDLVVLSILVATHRNTSQHTATHRKDRKENRHVNRMSDMLQHQAMSSPFSLLYGAVMVLLIAYAHVIPMNLRMFADSLLGRLLALAAIYGVIHGLGWVYGLLTAMAFLLILHGAVRSPMSSLEGFDGGTSEKKVSGRRWFVEKVLGETPAMISTDRVTTQPVQS